MVNVYPSKCMKKCISHLDGDGDLSMSADQWLGCLP